MSEATRAENVAPKPYDLEAHYQELEQKITAAGIPADLGRVRAAFECADRAHSGQKRRDGSPYVSHCIAAADHHGGDGARRGLDHRRAAARRDRGHLAHARGHRSAASAPRWPTSSRASRSSRACSTRASKRQQMENMRKMLLAMAKDIRVILIKMADRLHNMRTMAYQSEEKQRIKSLETMEIYAPIAHRLGMQKIKWELEDLSLLYLDPDGLQGDHGRARSAHADAAKNSWARCARRSAERLRGRGRARRRSTSRIKHIYSIYRKMYAQKLDINEHFRPLRVSRHRGHDPRLLQRARHHPRHVQAAARPVQGLHRHAEAEHVPERCTRRSSAAEGIPFEVQIRTWEMHLHGGVRRRGALEIQDRQRPGHKPGDEEKFAWIRRLLETQQDVGRAGLLPRPEDRHVRRRGVRRSTPKGDVINLARRGARRSTSPTASTPPSATAWSARRSTAAS